MRTGLGQVSRIKQALIWGSPAASAGPRGGGGGLLPVARAPGAPAGATASAHVSSPGALPVPVRCSNCVWPKTAVSAVEAVLALECHPWPAAPGSPASYRLVPPGAVPGSGPQAMGCQPPTPRAGHVASGVREQPWVGTC